MKTSATNRRIREILSDIRKGLLIPRPDFQRRLVWVNKHKNAFLRTVLEGYPFPEIYVAAGEVDTESAEAKELLVDGQQRVTTLYQYFSGSDELRLEAGIQPYSKLSPEEQLEFLEYEVVIRDLGKKSLDEIKTIFQRINSTNYALNAMEIHNSRYDGELAQFVEQLAQHEFFEQNRVFRPSEVRRMGDVRFALTVVISVLATYFHRDSELEPYLERYNEEFPQKDKLVEEIESVFQFMNQLDLDPKSRAWQKSDLLTLLVEVYAALVQRKLILAPDDVRQRLVTFYEAVNKVAEEAELGVEINPDVLAYRRATTQASNDRSSRIVRGKILASVIEGSFQI